MRWATAEQGSGVVSSEPAFHVLQDAFTAWVRDPALPPPAGIEPRRLAIYRELFFNNVCDFVATAYPVLKSLLPAAEWAGLLRDFFREHRAQSPYFRDISLEFRHWLQEARPDWLAARPWAAELLHFEWAELAADCAETDPEPAALAEGDLLSGIPVLRAATWPLAYRWPVHALAPGKPPAELPPALPTFLLLWRDDAGQVRQREASALACRLVELLQSAPSTGRDMLATLAAEAGHAGTVPPAFLEGGAALLAELRDLGLILGVRCDNAAPAPTLSDKELP